MTAAPPRRVGLRGALLRFLLMVAILVAAFFLFRDSALAEHLELAALTERLDQLRTLWWTPLAFVGLWALLSPAGLPASPLMAGGALVFGVWWGTLYNSLGALLGASVTYGFAHLLGRDLIVHLLGEERLARVERRLDRYGFKALVGIRFLPLPWPVVNFAAPLAGVSFGQFLGATLVGVPPIVFLYTLFYGSLIGVTTEQGRARIAQFLAAIAVLAALLGMRWYMRRRSRREEAG